MIVSRSALRLRKPSIAISAFIAASSFISRPNVLSSTFTSNTLSHRLARAIAP